MKILHILTEGKTDLASKIIEIQAQNHEIKIIDLSAKEKSYEAVIDEIFSSDRVITW